MFYRLAPLAAVAAASFMFAGAASAASFDCSVPRTLNPAERQICTSPRLGALDERLDSWYRRALLRAKHFGQVSELRAEQRDWIASRNTCDGRDRCIRRHYLERIDELKAYVEHV